MEGLTAWATDLVSDNSFPKLELKYMSTCIRTYEDHIFTTDTEYSRDWQIGRPLHQLLKTTTSQRSAEPPNHQNVRIHRRTPHLLRRPFRKMAADMVSIYNANLAHPEASRDPIHPHTSLLSQHQTSSILAQCPRIDDQGSTSIHSSRHHYPSNSNQILPHDHGIDGNRSIPVHAQSFSRHRFIPQRH